MMKFLWILWCVGLAFVIWMEAKLNAPTENEKHISTFAEPSMSVLRRPWYQKHRIAIGYCVTTAIFVGWVETKKNGQQQSLATDSDEKKRE
jgi:hypothetical protein